MFTTSLKKLLKSNFQQSLGFHFLFKSKLFTLLAFFVFLGLPYLSFSNTVCDQTFIGLSCQNGYIEKKVSFSAFNYHEGYAQMLILFRKAGINVTNNSKIKKRKRWLKELKFQLMHRQGLNFKLRITGFSMMEFRFIFDDQGQFQYFTYRINEEEVYQLIAPDTRGFKTYVCFDTGIVQEGETNNKIERFK